MDISVYVKKYLCSNLDKLDSYLLLKDRYNKKVMIIEKILILYRGKISKNKQDIMTNNIKINHFNLELLKINKKYKSDIKDLNNMFYEEKKEKFINIIAIFKDYIIQYLNNLKDKDCNEYLLYNLILEEKLKINISKFNIEKFSEIVNLVCKIFSSKMYVISYSKI